LTAESAALAASWFDGDEDGAREFGGFYGRHPKWWTMVARDPTRFGWLVWAADEPCGFVDLELADDGTASVSLYVRREYRNRGVGRAVLRGLGWFPLPAGSVQRPCMAVCT
jgi:GNAT superfamily N-acetyltransferase